MSEADAAPETTPCDRCGTFAPLTKRGSQMLCATCLERAKHEIETTPFTSRDVVSGTFSLLRAVGPAALVVALAAGAIDTGSYLLSGGNLHGPIRFAHLVLVLTVLPVCHGVVALLGMGEVVPDAPKGIAASLRQARSQWRTLIFADLVRNLWVGIYMVALIVPGVMRALALAIVTPLAASGGGGGTVGGVLEESERRMKGHRLTAFWPALLAALPVVVIQLGATGAMFVPGLRLYVAHTVVPLIPLVLEPLMVPVTLMTVVLLVKTRPVDEPEADAET